MMTYINPAFLSVGSTTKRAFVVAILFVTSCMLMLVSTRLAASESGELPNIEFFTEGKAHTPWEFSLQFGAVKLESNKGKTLRASLKAKPATRNEKNDALGLVWKPRGIKNEWGEEDKNILTATLTNTQRHTDLTKYVEQGVLQVAIRVVKQPKKFVELTMECAWNWKCRSAIPLNPVLKSLPKKKWVNLPIPLTCFDNGQFDFSKVTSGFMLYSGGKMEIEIGDIKVVNTAQKQQC